MGHPPPCCLCHWRPYSHCTSYIPESNQIIHSASCTPITCRHFCMNSLKRAITNNTLWWTQDQLEREPKNHNTFKRPKLTEKLGYSQWPQTFPARPSAFAAHLFRFSTIRFIGPVNMDHCIHHQIRTKFLIYFFGQSSSWSKSTLIPALTAFTFSNTHKRRVLSSYHPSYSRQINARKTFERSYGKDATHSSSLEEYSAQNFET